VSKVLDKNYLKAVAARNGLEDEPVTAKDLIGREIDSMEERSNEVYDVNYKGVTEVAGMQYDITIREVPKEFIVQDWW
jgi:hypothetical protein